MQFRVDAAYEAAGPSIPATAGETCEIIIEFIDEDDSQAELIKKYGVIKQYFPLINSYAVVLPKERVSMLRTLKNVAAVSENTRITAQMNNSRRALAADSAHRIGYDGAGVTLAFLDTGIAPVQDFTHPKNRIIGFRDFVEGRETPYDDNGHGTHVAGIAAGNGALSNGKYAGIAYSANIVAGKILDKNGHGNISHALSGLQWVADNQDRYNIRIVNLSIGCMQTNPRDPLVKAVNAVWDRGIIVTVASGNNGPDKRSVTSPGTSRKVITVGAADDSNRVQIWSDTLVNFSGRGPTNECVIKPDVLAPGAKIVSTLAPGSLLSADLSKTVDSHYACLSGTSMSTPAVAGALALLLHKYPALSPDEAKLALKYSCQDLSYPQNHQGWGLLNVAMLLKAEPGAFKIRKKQLLNVASAVSNQ